MAYRSSNSEVLRARAAIALLVLASSSVATVAHAREPDADDDLRRGVALRREGKEAEALQAFERALARSPSARARAQVGLTEQALALWLLAERDLALALADADDPWIRQNRDALERAARLVAGKLAWISVESSGTEVLVNGVSSPPAKDGRIRVVAGQVGVEVRAEGRAPASRTVQVAPETTMKVAIEVGPQLAPPRAKEPIAQRPTPASPPPPPPSGGLRTVGWVLTGAGVVSLGAGAIFGVRAITKKSERDSECQSGCTQAGVDADRSGRTAGLVSTITLAAGVGATAAGLIILFTSAPRDDGASAAVGFSGTSIDLRARF